MILQQPNSEDSPIQNQGFLSELCVCRCKNRRIVMLCIFLVGIILIIVGVYCGLALDKHKHMELGLIILLSCIAFGVIFACFIVCFARFLRSPRNSLSSLEAPSTTSRHVRTSNKSNAIVPVPAFCNSEENTERRPLQRGGSNFKHRSESQSRPVDCDSDIIEYEHKTCRESPNYIHRLPRRTRYINGGSTDDTKYDAMERGRRKARLMDYRNTHVKSYCRESGEINRRDLGENRLWARRNMYKSEHEPINSAKSNEFESRTGKISKSRTRSRSETREYRTKSNEELKSLYLSTRRTKGTKNVEINSSKEEMEMKDYKISGKGMERVSRRKSNKNKYFYENDKAVVGSETDFSNELDDRAEIKWQSTDRSAGYSQTNAKTISKYPYIRPQTTEPTSDYQSWQRHHFVHSSSSSDSEAISYPSNTCSDSSMKVGQYASRSSRNVATNLPKYKVDLNYASTSGIGQIYIPEGKRSLKLQQTLSENAIPSKSVAQHFQQYVPNSNRYSEQSLTSARKEYAKYLAMYNEKHKYPSV